jgi:uncharacterized protein (DUF433 family)/DNA-binding transcriptional MerR regulator
MAAALSGVTVGRLGYWRRGERPLLVPEISASDPVLYSFRDLVALRTFAYLREERPLQRIRKALDNLRDLGETEHLSKYRLVAEGRRNIVLVDEDQMGAVDLIERPGQSVTVVRLDDVLKSFPLRDIEVPNLLHPRKRIAVNPSIRRGYPVVQGTRVAYDLVAGLVRDGVPPEQVKKYYPGVTAEAARDAVAFADYVDRYTPRRAA